MTNPTTAPHQLAQKWWRTPIIDMQPGVVRSRGCAIEDLIGNIGLAQMTWPLPRAE